jgi:hypothetical protein
MRVSYNNNIFSVTFNGVNRPVGTLREECERKAREVYSENNKIILALSGGLDCQVVLHSFHSQGIPIKCAFMYMTGSNDFELNSVKILEKKYNLDLTIIEIDPNSVKDSVLEEHSVTGIPPYQLMHKQFLSMLPEEYTFIQGLDGPEFVKSKGIWYLLETANSFVNSRTRALQMVKRSGSIINWEKSPELYYSLMNDNIIKAYHDSFEYINNNGLMFKNGSEISVVNHWDLYMKPLVYAKHWGKDIEYFGKYQGPEKIDWIMNTKWHRYDLNRVFISINEMMSIMNTPGAEKTFYQQ